MSLIKITLQTGEEQLLNVNTIYKVVKNTKYIYESVEVPKSFLFWHWTETSRKRIGEEVLEGCKILTNEYTTRYIRSCERITSYQERVVLYVKEDYEQILSKANKESK